MTNAFLALVSLFVVVVVVVVVVIVLGLGWGRGKDIRLLEGLYYWSFLYYQA